MNACDTILHSYWRTEAEFCECLDDSERIEYLKNELEELEKLYDFWVAIEKGVFVGKYKSFKYKVLHFVFKIFFRR
ncbi:hypothetical protein DU472_04505 [Campylobacter novaezeelandiae]|uniref:hypothetical protein n=1 Tax=Campylobacter novaezeelandiae TaxID=2267891 RepID=UPI001037A0A3|nr:hypothetical protein [Campylobacter novaezeelandiae]TBR80924.1 hypothetical protein DU472_04505 [Campylobacter novaezeelandiae]